jgi:hypothetical protein
VRGVVGGKGEISDGIERALEVLEEATAPRATAARVSYLAEYPLGFYRVTIRQEPTNRHWPVPSGLSDKGFNRHYSIVIVIELMVIL